MEVRSGDVVQRREHKNKLKEERRVAEEAFHERERIRNEALEHARTVSFYLCLYKNNRTTRPRRMRDSERQMMALKGMKERKRGENSMRRASSANGTLKILRLMCHSLWSTTSMSTMISWETNEIKLSNYYYYYHMLSPINC